MHTCPTTSENSRVTSTYLAKKYNDMHSDNINYNLSSIKEKIRRECKVDVSDRTLYRNKRKAAKFNQGDILGQYNKL